jgi:hypothetical protein
MTERTHAEAPEADHREVVREPMLAPQPGAPAAATVLALQGSIGNRAVGRLLARTPEHSRPARRVQRVPTQVRFDRDEAGVGTSPGFRTRGRFEVDFTPMQCMVTVKIGMTRDANVTAVEQDAVTAAAEAEFLRLWDEKFYFDDDASHERFFVRFRVQWVTSGQHISVRLHRGPGVDNQTNWFIRDSFATDHAHELSHTLGLLDEYVDRTVVRRRTATSPGVFADHSLMGNYRNEGFPGPVEVKLRHAQELARRIGTATHRQLTPGWTGPAQGERLVRWRGVRDAAAAGSAERTSAQAEVDAIERDLMIPAGGP